MLKFIKFIFPVFIVSLLCVSCISAGNGGDAEKTKPKNGDYIDFGLYPAASFKNKGVLYMDKSEFAQKQIVLYVFREDGGHGGVWYLGGDSMSIYDSSTKPSLAGKATKIGHINPGTDRFIVGKEFLNVIDDGQYYIVSARAVSQEGYYAIPLRISKNHAAAYGFKFIPLESVVEICKKNLDMAQDMIGTEITPSKEDFERIRKSGTGSRSPEIDGKPGEEIISVAAAEGELPEEHKRIIYILRKKPSLSSPFIRIEEAAITGKRVLFKKNYWYELEVSGTAQRAGADYAAGRYKGFWQAPYDENGFPYLITEMVKDSWEKLAGEYFSDNKSQEAEEQ